MKKLIVVFLVLFSCVAVKANDDDFSFVQPIDNKVKKALKWENPELAADISDWSLWIMNVWPIVEAFNGNKVLPRLASYGVSHYMAMSFTAFTKSKANRTRPNGKGDESFFSGHTSAVFASAGFLCATENRDKCLIGLGLASTTGYLRIAGNRHFFTDVVVGAIVGYASGYAIPVLIFEF